MKSHQISQCLINDSVTWIYCVCVTSQRPAANQLSNPAPLPAALWIIAWVSCAAAALVFTEPTPSAELRGAHTKMTLEVTFLIMRSVFTSPLNQCMELCEGLLYNDVIHVWQLRKLQSIGSLVFMLKLLTKKQQQKKQQYCSKRTENIKKILQFDQFRHELFQ